jgi:putative FmdB family regulatory protein
VPIYEYQCPKCAHRFEMIHDASDKDRKIICPSCGDSKAQRVISLFSCGGARGSEIGSTSACGPKPGRFS